MRAYSVRHHSEYGEPLHLIKVVRPTKWTMVVTLLSVSVFSSIYFDKGLKVFSLLDIGFFLFFSFVMLKVIIAQFFTDKDDIHLIIYEKGVWSHRKFWGSGDHFIPWGDIESFEKGELGGKLGVWAVFVHVLDKAHYNQKTPVGLRIIGRILVLLGYKSCLYIPVTGNLEIKCDDLIALLNTELENWRSRSGRTQPEREGA